MHSLVANCDIVFIYSHNIISFSSSLPSFSLLSSPSQSMEQNPPIRTPSRPSSLRLTNPNDLLRNESHRSDSLPTVTHDSYIPRTPSDTYTVHSRGSDSARGVGSKRGSFSGVSGGQIGGPGGPPSGSYSGGSRRGSFNVPILGLSPRAGSFNVPILGGSPWGTLTGPQSQSESFSGGLFSSPRNGSLVQTDSLRGGGGLSARGSFISPQASRGSLNTFNAPNNPLLPVTGGYFSAPIVPLELSYRSDEKSTERSTGRGGSVREEGKEMRKERRSSFVLTSCNPIDNNDDGIHRVDNSILNIFNNDVSMTYSDNNDNISENDSINYQNRENGGSECTPKSQRTNLGSMRSQSENSSVKNPFWSDSRILDNNQNKSEKTVRSEFSPKKNDDK